MQADDITIHKLVPSGEEVFRYQGRILRRTSEALVLEARFTREDLPFHGILMAQGDRFIETYYTNRWYNIFEMHSHIDDHLTGWYCNISRPARICPHDVWFIDLALDLLVFPDGRQLVLDEDEFAVLSIDDAERKRARAALKELQDQFIEKRGMADSATRLIGS